MNCYFCHQQLVGEDKIPHSFICHQCPVPVKHLCQMIIEPYSHLSASFPHFVKGIEYEINLNFLRSVFSIYSITRGEMVQYYTLTHKELFRNMILQLDFIPNVNPINIKEKFPTLINFS
jgi:hypothetical protein